MVLTTHGCHIDIGDKNNVLLAEYQPSDGGVGSLTLVLEDQSSMNSVRRTLQLDPWMADRYELYESTMCEALIICGARAIVALRSSILEFGCSIALEYEEAETIDRPWFTDIPDRRFLVVATERRAWCIDDRVAFRWIWNCRTDEEDRWISGAPLIEGARLLMPVRSLHREFLIEISMDEGNEKN